MKDTTELFIARNVAMWRLLTVILMMTIAFILAACGDDESSFAPRDDEFRSSSESVSPSSSERGGGDSYSSSSAKSSSSVTPKSCSGESSSSAMSSSSSFPMVYVKVEYGTLTDERDGKSYKTVVIGSQTWMAQNLDYQSENSFCFNDSAAYCARLGRLYTWASAMDSAGTWSLSGKGCGYGVVCSPTNPVRGVCPEGWHLPTMAEYEDLFVATGGRSTAPLMLKSTTGWYKDRNGIDAFGFSAFPAGSWNGNYFLGSITSATFWTTTEDYELSVFGFNLDYDSQVATTYNKYFKEYAFSVRCLKDYEKNVESSSSVMFSSSSSFVSPKSSDCVTLSEVEGVLCDSRDGQTYKTIVIGTQTWMAQNLNYETANSYCYNDDASNCAKLGRLYTWTAAMDSTGTWSSNGVGCGYGNRCSPTYPVRGVCPEGWHLPTGVEWDTRCIAEGGCSVAAKGLKSISSDNGSGDNSYTALLTGFRSDNGFYANMAEISYYWSSAQYDDVAAHYRYLYSSLDNVFDSYASKDYSFSVRCVKDDD